MSSVIKLFAVCVVECTCVSYCDCYSNTTCCLLQGLSWSRWSPWQRWTLELYRWRRWCYRSSGSGRKSHVQDAYMHGEMSFVFGGILKLLLCWKNIQIGLLTIICVICIDISLSFIFKHIIYGFINGIVCFMRRLLTF